MNTTRRSFIGAVAALLLPWRKPQPQLTPRYVALRMCEYVEIDLNANPLFSGDVDWIGSAVVLRKNSRLPAEGDRRRPLA